MRLLITETQYSKILKESFDISEDEMSKLKVRAENKYKKIQEEIKSLEEELKFVTIFFETTLPNIKDSELFKHYNLKGVIDYFTNKKNETTSRLNQIKNKTFETLLNDEISHFTFEKEKIKERETKEITKENLYDLINTALEGGSNYWYHIKHLPKSLIYDIDVTNKPFSDAVTDYVFDGNTINFYDIETDEFLGSLTMDGILDAISILKNEYPQYYEDILDEHWDAETADTFLQLAVLGDITFG